MIVASIGCPAGVGPEVSVAAAARLAEPVVLVGDLDTVRAAAEVVGVGQRRIVKLDAEPSSGRKIYVWTAGPTLSARDRRPGRPTRASGAAQLAWVDAAYDLVRAAPGRALVTGPVSKAAIARSGARGAARFVGHTEWLGERDGAERTVMCFAAPALVTSLVTTHLPVAAVPRAIEPRAVAAAVTALGELLTALGVARPRIAVCSLNPHAGEAGMFGAEERRAILPGIRAARRRRSRLEIVGPVGAETAFRQAASDHFDGVVAMYHDQATIPMKLVAFGDAVNVTMGLSIVRTSVDHGTGYDIAWQGRADAKGMLAAMRLGARLVSARR